MSAPARPEPKHCAAGAGWPTASGGRQLALAGQGRARLIDARGDRRPDAVLFDSNGDRRFDWGMVDCDRDGRLDRRWDDGNDDRRVQAAELTRYRGPRGAGSRCASVAKLARCLAGRDPEQALGVKGPRRRKAKDDAPPKPGPKPAPAPKDEPRSGEETPAPQPPTEPAPKPARKPRTPPTPAGIEADLDGDGEKEPVMCDGGLAGAIQQTDTDNDGDSDEVVVGTSAGHRPAGKANLDNDPGDDELVVQWVRPDDDIQIGASGLSVDRDRPQPGGRDDPDVVLLVLGERGRSGAPRTSTATRTRSS